MSDLTTKIGFYGQLTPEERQHELDNLKQYVTLQMSAHGLHCPLEESYDDLVGVADGLLKNYRQKMHLLHENRCPADRRIEAFLDRYFADVREAGSLRVPSPTLVLDRHGMARTLSLPTDRDEFTHPLVSSHRVANGVLNNPLHDRRTTSGTFHVVEGGLPIPGDKKAVPVETFARLFEIACDAPEEFLTLPITAYEDEKASSFVSLLLRPTVSPEVKGVVPQRTMETRFFAPGLLVSNLDFVESIFGNAGDPFLPHNDAGLDVEHWTGHTGAILLAPWMIHAKKKDVGLPHKSEANDRQIRDGMCWESEDELYNDGKPFKLTCRDASGVIVTLIGDNYYGYSKKEVKTQLSYAANLLGNAEEEHAGGAVAYPAFMLGEEFQVDSQRYNGRTFQDVVNDYSDLMKDDPETTLAQGYGVDKNFEDVIYIHEKSRVSLIRQAVSWKRPDGEIDSIPLEPGKMYIAPSGYKVRMEKHPGAPSWRLVGIAAEGMFCHKPNTVSGGGKSEISKSIVDYMHYGPVFVANLDEDLKLIDEIISRNYSDRWHPNSTEKPDYSTHESRPLLHRKRSLGSVIQLMTPSPEFNDDYNDWLKSLPSHIVALVFVIKRFYQPSWDGDWRSHFSVDMTNGRPGHELKFHDRKLIGTYLRVGLIGHSWRTFKVRQDFAAAEKIQTEDDITASTIVPSGTVANLPDFYPESAGRKFAVNCEYRLFQRPDDAIHRGLDKQTEYDLSRPDNFISNFEPLPIEKIREMKRSVIDFDAFTPPMQEFLNSALEEGDVDYVVCSANPRQVDGKPTKNPRYLQNRPDLDNPMKYYVADLGTRLFRKLPLDQPVHQPVGAVLMGRRNNPPDKEAGIKMLAVYNPIHYQELPELFMDLICSLSGKSPSTTGAGSEGALTKGPFNALRPAPDLNNALVSYILTGLDVFSTAAGFVGPDVRVDHDISLLIPEIWCRLSPSEVEPQRMIEKGLLEQVPDPEHNGKTLSARRLGYRVTARFIKRYFGRVFDHPSMIFDEAILQPETQDREAFFEGLEHIIEQQEQVAQRYLADESYEDCCPPLQALIDIMAKGDHHGLTLEDEELRNMFTLESLLNSDWYRERLEAKQQTDLELWQRHLEYLTAAEASPILPDESMRGEIQEQIALANRKLDEIKSPTYLESLRGTMGTDPSVRPGHSAPAVTADQVPLSAAAIAPLTDGTEGTPR